MPEKPEDMVLIPKGEFMLGLDSGGESPEFLSGRTSSLNAQPQHKYYLDEFYIDINEVTYEKFLKFKPQAKYPDGKSGQPVRGVSWFEAEAYCYSLGKRLPTEMEWEKSARGLDGRFYVWGNDFKRENSNLGKKIQNVRNNAKDKSVFGVYDMNGNVSEWTASWYLPYSESQLKDDDFGKKFKVIRGGSINKREHGFIKEFALLPYRNYAPPKIRSWDMGFRCAKSAASKLKGQEADSKST